MIAAGNTAYVKPSFRHVLYYPPTQQHPLLCHPPNNSSSPTTHPRFTAISESAAKVEIYFENSKFFALNIIKFNAARL